MAKKKARKDLETKTNHYQFPQKDLQNLPLVNVYDQNLVLAMRTYSYQTSHRNKHPKYSR